MGIEIEQIGSIERCPSGFVRHSHLEAMGLHIHCIDERIQETNQVTFSRSGACRLPSEIVFNQLS